MSKLLCWLGLHRWHRTNGRLLDFGGKRCMLVYGRTCVRCSEAETIVETT